MSKACEVINEQLSHLLKGKDLSLFKKIDDQLKTFKSREEEDPEIKIGTNIISAVSHALYAAFARALSTTKPFLAIFKQIAVRDFRPDQDMIPKLMLSVLNGGKESGSKIKFSKFYIIFNMSPQDTDTIDAHEVYIKLCAAIEKTLSSTKIGLAGFKR